MALLEASGTDNCKDAKTSEVSSLKETSFPTLSFGLSSFPSSDPFASLSDALLATEFTAVVLVSIGSLELRIAGVSLTATLVLMVEFLMSFLLFLCSTVEEEKEAFAATAAVVLVVVPVLCGVAVDAGMEAPFTAVALLPWSR